MRKKFFNIITLGLISLLVGFFLMVAIFLIYGRDLPNLDKLSYYKPRLVSKLFTYNGNFLEDYSNENRVFSSYDDIPSKLIECFLVSEDISFFSHSGVDLKGIVRAFFKNILKTFSNRRLEGASTITQQVAKNFLLSNEISYSRKIKEIILSFRIEGLLSKEQIMELYLNEIYLGNGSYGVRSASLNYFNKSLNELELIEMAMLAALPKAPSTYNPFRNPTKAQKRRDWVLKRLFDESFIEIDEYNSMVNMPLKLSKKKKILDQKAMFFKEAVRREIVSKFNESKLYDGGLSIMTTLDENLQLFAEQSFKEGIKSFDKRKGWRGPIDNFKSIKDWRIKLENFKNPDGLYNDFLAIVLEIKDDILKVGTKKGRIIEITINELKIIKKKKIKLKNEIKVGDIVVLKSNHQSQKVMLSQIPDVDGAMVVIDNYSGRVLAMVGGYNSNSSFNRATQAKRQLGSAFKPFIYVSALENGYSPASKILDAPFVLNDQSSDGIWRPTNYGNKFYGLSTLRLGIEKSRNLMTVRLADELGLDKIAKISENLEIYESFPYLISSSLGSLESTLIKITSAYASIANGGKKIQPVLLDAIQDNNGNFLYKRDSRKCIDCLVDEDDDIDSIVNNDSILPTVDNNKISVFSKESAYQMTSFLMGVIKRGTAKSINKFDFQIAGKTGTTNDNQDAWFIGYTSEITVGVYVGYDKPKSLGKFETGSKVAAPIFESFMKKVYNSRRPMPFYIPKTIKFINVDLFTGESTDTKFISEAFKSDFKFEKNLNKKKVKEQEYDLRGFY